MSSAKAVCFLEPEAAVSRPTRSAVFISEWYLATFAEQQWPAVVKWTFVLGVVSLRNSGLPLHSLSVQDLISIVNGTSFMMPLCTGSSSTYPAWSRTPLNDEEADALVRNRMQRLRLTDQPEKKQRQLLLRQRNLQPGKAAAASRVVSGFFADRQSAEQVFLSSLRAESNSVSLRAAAASASFPERVRVGSSTEAQGKAAAANSGFAAGSAAIPVSPGLSDVVDVGGFASSAVPLAKESAAALSVGAAKDSRNVSNPANASISSTRGRGGDEDASWRQQPQQRPLQGFVTAEDLLGQFSFEPPAHQLDKHQPDGATEQHILSAVSAAAGQPTLVPPAAYPQASQTGEFPAASGAGVPTFGTSNSNTSRASENPSEISTAVLLAGSEMEIQRALKQEDQQQQRHHPRACAFEIPLD
ncbi:hypothetical protein cyc_06563 [Cyclospora cayetanensis]|uniref:Uncharacterized protein n=1 Tax=Cyclospora cayetanensis TaxID=88456 RepID=A0A1D3D3G6_9EIME|nr:hypothetical protein cyc_06563 [Cyclospora cayetanensis]